MGLSASQVNVAGLVDTISLGVSAKPVIVAINEITDKIYIADQDNQKIYAIDGLTNNVIMTISLAGKPEAISFNKNTNRLYAP